jgi:peptidoglycan/LPS O-acetylase OafA/YrhL
MAWPRLKLLLVYLTGLVFAATAVLTWRTDGFSGLAITWVALAAAMFVVSTGMFERQGPTEWPKPTKPVRRRRKGQ